MFRRFLLIFGLSMVAVLAAGNRAHADSVVTADRALIISGHPQATKLGIDVLKRGGNAVDALVTVSLSLGVTEPGNSGLGGKIVVLYYDAKTKDITCLASLGQAARTLPIDELIGKSADERKRGYDAACVPGLAAALSAAHQKWGTQAWESLIDAPIALAENGFELSPLAAEMLDEFPLEIDSEAARIYAREGKHLKAGDTLRNPDLANTMRLLAAHGADGFYKGEVAQKIASAMKANGGFLDEADFAGYQPRFLKPLKGSYQGYTIFSSPPPLSGGATLLAALGALEGADWGPTIGSTGARGKDAVVPRDARYIDTVSRVLQQLYPEIQRSAGDAPDSLERVAKILDPQYLREIARKAGTADVHKGALSSAVRGGGLGQLASVEQFDDPVMDDSEQASTTHLLIIDRFGNIVCATQSLGNHFGSGVVAPGTGVLLNNDMNNFAYATQSSINYVAPGKWPRSTMTPTIVLDKRDKPLLVIGSPGGQRIPTGVLQITLDVLQFNRKLEDAVNGPRFHLRRAMTSKDAVNEVDLDKEFEQGVEDQLKTKGWSTFRRNQGEFYFGAVNAALFLPSGKILGVADQRRTGDAGGS